MLSENDFIRLYGMIYIYVCICMLCMYVMYKYIYVLCIHICMYVLYVYLYVCIYVCTYVYVCMNEWMME